MNDIDLTLGALVTDSVAPPLHHLRSIARGCKNLPVLFRFSHWLFCFLLREWRKKAWRTCISNPFPGPEFNEHLELVFYNPMQIYSSCYDELWYFKPSLVQWNPLFTTPVARNRPHVAPVCVSMFVCKSVCFYLLRCWQIPILQCMEISNCI